MKIMKKMKKKEKFEETKKFQTTEVDFEWHLICHLADFNLICQNFPFFLILEK